MLTSDEQAAQAALAAQTTTDPSTETPPADWQQRIADGETARQEAEEAKQNAAEAARQLGQTATQQKLQERYRDIVQGYMSRGMSQEHAQQAARDQVSFMGKATAHIEGQGEAALALLSAIKTGVIDADKAKELFDNGATVAEIRAAVSTSTSETSRVKQLEAQLAAAQRDSGAPAQDFGLANNPGVSGNQPNTFDEKFFASVFADPYSVTDAQLEAYRQRNPDLTPA